MSDPTQFEFLKNIDCDIQFNAPIGNMTYFEIGGHADTLATPKSVAGLQELLRLCHEHDLPIHILGKGANLLIDDAGIDGVVISLLHDCFKTTAFDEQSGNHNLHCMAGADLSKTIMQTARDGMHGLESLAGIPATIGGGIRMNAGGKYGSISDNLTSVHCLSSKGELVVYNIDELEFSYRHSNIIEPLILSGTFALTSEDPEVVRERVKDIFAWKKSMQPLADTSAGCAFKNPVDENGQRISAGKLIDQSGLKGTSKGGAAVSQQHANFITTSKGATAQDVIAVMNTIEKKVFDYTGITLQREVVVWSRCEVSTT